MDRALTKSALCVLGLLAICSFSPLVRAADPGGDFAPAGNNPAPGNAPAPNNAPPAGGAAAPADGQPLEKAEITPGTTIKIADPATGGLGYWLLYIPSDYVPTRKWPVIYYYHGLNGKPLVSVFQYFTGGKGYIILGMDYVDRNIKEPQVDQNLANLKRIHDAISKKLSIDDSLQFLTGQSQGGFRTADYGEASLDTWAGLVILLAGRGVDGPKHPEGNGNYNGKPIFIGDGENDDYLPLAKQAATFYQSHGADVTFEVFPNKGHEIDRDCVALKKWLLEHGPMVERKRMLAAAQDAEESGKLGQAYVTYQSFIAAATADAAVPDANGTDAAATATDAASSSASTDQSSNDLNHAKAKAAKIAAGADKANGIAEADIAAGNLSDAVKELVWMRNTYAGSEFGDKAAAKLASLRSDPSTSAQLNQSTIDTAADAAEARAIAAEKSGDYQTAIDDYKAYVTAYPKSRRIAEVSAHLKSLESDPAIQSKIADKEADTNCKSWMNLAENYINNGDTDRGKEYLHKIIDQYPNTSWAKTAQEKLDALN